MRARRPVKRARQLTAGGDDPRGGTHGDRNRGLVLRGGGAPRRVAGHSAPRDPRAHRRERRRQVDARQGARRLLCRESTGTLDVFGERADNWDPLLALSRGVAIMHQELQLVPELTVAENVFLGLEEQRFGVLRRTEGRRLEELMTASGFRLDPNAIVSRLPIADQQKIEILRALARDARIIVMDEPTSTLSRDEVSQLHVAMRKLRDEGRSIIYVSHFINDILEVADRITVLRDGEHVKTAPAAGETRSSLIAAMLGGGKSETPFPPRVRPDDPEPVLEVVDLVSPRGASGASLVVGRGENRRPHRPRRQRPERDRPRRRRGGSGDERGGPREGAALSEPVHPPVGGPRHGDVPGGSPQAGPRHDDARLVQHDPAAPRPLRTGRRHAAQDRALARHAAHRALPGPPPGPGRRRRDLLRREPAEDPHRQVADGESGHRHPRRAEPRGGRGGRGSGSTSRSRSSRRRVRAYFSSRAKSRRCWASPTVPTSWMEAASSRR